MVQPDMGQGLPMGQQENGTGQAEKNTALNNRQAGTGASNDEAQQHGHDQP